MTYINKVKLGKTCLCGKYHEYGFECDRCGTFVGAEVWQTRDGRLHGSERVARIHDGVCANKSAKELEQSFVEYMKYYKQEQRLA